MTEIRIESTRIDQISCLVISGDSPRPAPLIFFVHGYESDKRQGIPLGVELARRGFIAVSIDTILRGERLDQEFDPITGPIFQKVYSDEVGMDGMITMLKIIRQTELDLRTLIDHFRLDSRVDPQKIGLVGYSMGGWVAFHSSANLPAIKAAVSIAGIPYFTQRWNDLLVETSTYPEFARELDNVKHETSKRTAFIEKMDPSSILIDQFPNPILMLCGEVDTVAPKKYCLDLYGQIKQQHQPGPDLLKVSIYDGIGHLLDLKMAEETAGWLGNRFGTREG